MSPAASSWLPFAGICLLYFCFLAFLGRRYWKSFQASAPGKNFTYRITDFWAAMVALTPTMVLIVVTASYPTTEIVIICAFLGASQAFGMFVGKLGFGRYIDNQSAFGSAIDIILGGLFGIGVLVGFFFILITLVVMSRAVPLQVMLGVLAVCYVILHVLTRKK
jgi:hypothetical protein